MALDVHSRRPMIIFILHAESYSYYLPLTVVFTHPSVKLGSLHSGSVVSSPLNRWLSAQAPATSEPITPLMSSSPPPNPPLYPAVAQRAPGVHTAAPPTQLTVWTHKFQASMQKTWLKVHQHSGLFCIPSTSHCLWQGSALPRGSAAVCTLRRGQERRSISVRHVPIKTSGTSSRLRWFT